MLPIRDLAGGIGGARFGVPIPPKSKKKTHTKQTAMPKLTRAISNLPRFVGAEHGSSVWRLGIFATQTVQPLDKQNIFHEVLTRRIELFFFVVTVWRIDGWECDIVCS